MASNFELRRRSSLADRNPSPSDPAILSPADSVSSATSATTTTLFSPTPDSTSHAALLREQAARPARLDKQTMDVKNMPPPPFPLEEAPPKFKRFTHARAHSTASVSRQANRLSLTLPIAVPTTDPSRHSHTSSITNTPSIPQSPIDTPNIPSPSDSGDFIIAIAAQERKVLELREELTRAETELANLKRQLSSREAFNKRTVELHQVESPKLVASPDGAASPSRRSVDFDKKRLLLQTQAQNAPTTPTQGRRRVIRGGHTRTLSLLSPTRTNSEFPVHDDNSIDAILNRSQTLPQNNNQPTPGKTPLSAKRSTWQPRTQPNTPGVPQLVEDFRVGLRAFVEDIRQITVGDEPINGHSTKSSPRVRGHASRASVDGGDPTKRVARSRTGLTPDTSTQSLATTATPAEKKATATATVQEKAKKQKHFSWTPLGFETLDDNEWTSWESQSPMSAKSTKSTRWSGSTVHSGGSDDIESIPEQPDTPSKTKSVSFESPLRSTKLEELLPSVVNRLSPVNFKRTANHLMEEWEKSLIEPDRDKENAA